MQQAGAAAARASAPVVHPFVLQLPLSTRAVLLLGAHRVSNRRHQWHSRWQAAAYWQEPAWAPVGAQVEAAAALLASTALAPACLDAAQPTTVFVSRQARANTCAALINVPGAGAQ